jgi:hypothetical protein
MDKALTTNVKTPSSEALAGQEDAPRLKQRNQDLPEKVCVRPGCGIRFAPKTRWQDYHSVDCRRQEEAEVMQEARRIIKERRAQEKGNG